MKSRSMLVFASFLALVSASSAFAQGRFIRVTNSSSNPDGTEFYGPTMMRPSLSADGTRLLYTMFSSKNDIHAQSVQMDTIALTNPPTLVRGAHIEFPTGAPAGANVYLSTQPSMSASGSVVATTPVYQSSTGEFRDNLKIFSIGSDNVPQILFEKSGEEVDSINSVRVSANGRFVAYVVVEYLEEQGEKSTVFTYDVQSKTEKAVWSNVTEFGNVGVKGISDDGTRVLLGSAYESEPTGGNLSVLNISTGAVTMVTDIKEEQKAPNSGSWDGNGVMAAFAASAPLVKGDTNRALDVYLASTAKSNSVPMLRISALGSKQGNYSSGQPDISRNGKFVAFISRADNLRQNDANYVKDLYVYSLNLGTLSSFVAGNEDIDAPTVNDSGAVVAFVSSASNITPNDTVGTKDIFVGVPSPLRPGSVGGIR